MAQADPRRDDLIAAALSAGRKVRNPATKYTSLGIAERFPELNGLPGPLAAELALQKLEGFAAAAIAGADPVGKLLGAQIKRQMVHLEGAGMAIGSPAMTPMLAQVVAKTANQGAAAFTQAEADALQDVSAVDEPVTTNEVSDVLNEGL